MRRRWMVMSWVTVVVGPFFILASCLSVVRQSGRLDVDVEVPILVIIAGLLLLVARSPSIPIPKWVIENARATARGNRRAKDDE